MIQATDRVGPAYKYSWAAGKIVNLSLLQQEDANSQSHVTGHTRDGLCTTFFKRRSRVAKIWCAAAAPN